MSSIRGTAKFETGRSGERRVAELLIERGWYGIPSYDYAAEHSQRPKEICSRIERLLAGTFFRLGRREAAWAALHVLVLPDRRVRPRPAEAGAQACGAADRQAQRFFFDEVGL
jgi:hypothetical protein